MKDIKSMIIGFLLATCMLLMMGQGSNTTGRYQGFATGNKTYLVDTVTGQMWFSQGYRGGYFWKERIEPNDFRKNFRTHSD